MTEATEKPVARVLTARNGKKYVVELTTDLITIREKGARRDGPGGVTIGVWQLHDRLLMGRGR